MYYIPDEPSTVSRLDTVHLNLFHSGLVFNPTVKCQFLFRSWSVLNHTATWQLKFVLFPTYSQLQSQMTTEVCFIPDLLSTTKPNGNWSLFYSRPALKHTAKWQVKFVSSWLAFNHTAKRQLKLVSFRISSQPHSQIIAVASEVYSTPLQLSATVPTDNWSLLHTFSVVKHTANWQLTSFLITLNQTTKWQLKFILSWSNHQSYSQMTTKFISCLFTLVKQKAKWQPKLFQSW